MSEASDESELVRLAGRLSTRPIGPDSYRLQDLLAGLAAERDRLGKRRFVATLYQNAFELDGLTDYVFLLDAFDSQSEAAAFAEARAKVLREAQLGTPDAIGGPWRLESEGEMRALPQPASHHAVRALFDRTYKLRAGPYDTKYSCFRVIGPFSDFVVGDALFDFINAPDELWSYFVRVGEAIRTEGQRPSPL